MHILAAILDPDDNGFDTGDLLVLFSILVAFAGSWAAVDRWLDRTRGRREKKRSEAQSRLTEQIRSIVKEATRQIHPDANGGKSLADVAVTVQDIRATQREIQAQVADIDDRLTQRMNAADAERARIMRLATSDRKAWVKAMEKHGIDTPTDPYEKD